MALAKVVNKKLIQKPGLRLESLDSGALELLLVSSRTISALWVGNPLSHYEQLCLKSFLPHGYRVQLFTYDEQILSPDGVERVDAREILGERYIFENHRYPGTFTFFSNLFRYVLLFQEDTLWIDADIFCLSDSLPNDEYLFGLISDNELNTAVLAAPQGSEFLQRMIDETLKFDPTKIIWGQTGPKLLQRVVNEFNLLNLAQSVNVFYPIHYREVWKLFDPESREEISERVAKSTCIHLWNEYFRRAPLPIKQYAPPVQSFLGEKFTELDIDLSGIPVLENDWARDTWQHILNPHVPLKQKLKNKIHWELTKLRTDETY